MIRKAFDASTGFLKGGVSSAAETGAGFLGDLKKRSLGSMSDMHSAGKAEGLSNDDLYNQVDGSLQRKIYDQADNFQKNYGGDDIMKNAFSTGATGAMFGAAGGMLSEDQSVLGGATMGLLAGGIAGGGAKAIGEYGKRGAIKANTDLSAKASRSGNARRSLRRKNATLREEAKGADFIDEYIMNPNNAEGIRGVAARKELRTNEKSLRNVSDLHGRNMKNLRSNKEVLNRNTDINPWVGGGLVGGGLLAHNVLDSNGPF